MVLLATITAAIMSAMCSNDIQYATVGKCFHIAKTLNESTEGYTLQGVHVKTTPSDDCLEFTNECTIEHSILGKQTITETFDYRERCRNLVRITSQVQLNLPQPIGSHSVIESFDIRGGEDHQVANISEIIQSLMGVDTREKPPTTIRVILRDGSSGSGADHSIDFWSRIETRSGPNLYTNTNGMLINENPLSVACSSLSDRNTVSVFAQYTDAQCTDIMRSFFVSQVDSECTGVMIKTKGSYEHRTKYASGVCTEDALYLSSLYDHCSLIPFNTATGIVQAGMVGQVFMLPNDGTCVKIDNSYYKATRNHACTEFVNIKNTQSICAWRPGYVRGAHTVIGSNLTRGECMDHARTYTGFGSWCGVSWSGVFDYEPGVCYAVTNDCRGPLPSSETFSQWSCLIQSDHKGGYNESPLFLVILIGAAFVICPLCGIVLGITIWRRHTSTYQTNLLRAARGVVTGVPLPPIREGNSYDDPTDCSPVHNWPINVGGDDDDDRESEEPSQMAPNDESEQSPSSASGLINASSPSESLPSEEISESNPLAVAVEPPLEE